MFTKTYMHDIVLFRFKSMFPLNHVVSDYISIGIV